MAEWYSKIYKSSDFVRDPEKKHYTITGIDYSFKVVLHGDSSEVLGVYYYMAGETSTRNSGRFSGQVTCTGSAPYKRPTSLACTPNRDYPMYFGDPSTTPSNPYYVIKDVAIAVAYGEKATPVATASYTGGFIDFTTAKAVVFGTKINNNIDEQYTVSAGRLYYREAGSEAEYSRINFQGNTLTIPANTFQVSKTYEAYANLILDDSTACQYVFNPITTDDVQGVCTGIRPQNEVTYGEVEFQWDYSTSTGTSQYAFDLQISADGTNWTDVFQHVVTSQTKATYTQTSPGDSYWRVRGYNHNDVAGAWSTPLYYINNVPPEPPVITGINGAGRQTVTWEAPTQLAYRVMVKNEDDLVVFDTGEVYSGSKSALINEYLEDGTYTFMVKIATDTGGWSDWADAQKTVGATLAAPSFTLTDAGEGIQITVESDAAYERFYVVRNGELIGKVQTFVEDFFVSGTAVYRVIGVGSDDAYGYSIQTITFRPDHDQIVTEEGEIILVNTRWNDRSFPQRSISPKFATYEFLGEDRPVHVFADGFRKGSFTVTAFDEADNFKNLLTKRVYLNTMAGWGDWCVVTSLNRAEGMWGNDTAISLDMTTGPEADIYEI